MSAQIPVPDIGAIIPTVRGRKRAYMAYAVIALVVGNATVFCATAWGTVPGWLIAAGAVVSNCAPIFASIAVANAKNPIVEIEKA